MKLIRSGICVVALAIVSLNTGCVGENILTAGAKVLNGQISQLTANEIKILNQSAAALINAQEPGLVPILTDAQAAALSNFFEANALNTIEDFEALASEAAGNPDAVEGLDQLATAFAGTDSTFDPENPDSSDIQEIFQAIFGGGDFGDPFDGDDGDNDDDDDHNDDDPQSGTN